MEGIHVVVGIAACNNTIYTLVRFGHIPKEKSEDNVSRFLEMPDTLLPDIKPTKGNNYTTYLLISITSQFSMDKSGYAGSPQTHCEKA